MFVILCFFALPVLAQTTVSERQKHFLLENGIALSGYDPISYFDNAPQKGKAELAFTQEGITYHFANQANLDKFKANPAKYEPVYGGWCAYAVGSYSGKTKSNPLCYKIGENGKLYLFYGKGESKKVLELWNKDEAQMLPKSVENWKKMLE